MRTVMLAALLAVLFRVAGRRFWARWRAFGPAEDMKGRSYW